MIIEERWYQVEAVNSVFEYFDSGKKGNPLIGMPTGTGKSIVIGELIRRIFAYYPNQRVMMLTHVKKLIQQNAAKLMQVWPTAPLGIYSAGLNSRDMILPIVFGGVKSVANAIKRSELEETLKPPHMRHFGWRDLLFIDESHLLSPEEDTMYQYVISELRKINPKIKVIGFTATPYRLKQGMLTDNGIFTDFAYDITDVESFNRLIAEGYLAPLFARPTRTELDFSQVSVLGGEYNAKQADAIIDTDENVYACVKEMCEAAYDRQCWMVFASGINNSEHIAAVLQSFGISAVASHSKHKDADERIEAWQRGEYRAIVSANKLTTGIDHPPVDYIGDLQLTMSPAKHVQKYGRGTRPSQATGKRNCLVGDFCGNVRRLGPINDPKIPNRPGKGGGDAPVWICDQCGFYNAASARECVVCGQTHEFKQKLFGEASDLPIIKTDAPIIEYADVHKVVYSLHEKKNREGLLTSPPMIKVTYWAGFSTFDKFIGLEHKGKFLHDSREWWRMHHPEEPPTMTWQALQKVNELRWPKKIRVHVNLKHPEILGFEF